MTDGFRFAFRSDGGDEVRQDAEVAVDAVIRREWRQFDRLEGVEQPVARAAVDDLDADLIGPVPSQRARCADETPSAFPRRAQANGAPRTAVDEDGAVLEFEDRCCGGALTVPGIRRVPFVAVDGRRAQSGHAAHSVEAVDRHVEQQDVIHLLAKAAEVRREKEVGVNAGDRADCAGTQRPRNAADAWNIAAVLDDGVDAARSPGARDEIARVGERFGHRLFA